MAAAPSPSVEDLVAGIRRGDRTLLGQALTLVESRHPEHRHAAAALLAALPVKGTAVRVGVSGLPGAGKSTLIERLGTRLVGAGHRVAVLAVDPSSTISGGSILGDKTRMTDLARSESAFVRPSPSGGSLGGVAERTRESIRVVEAAGFDVVLVETVGVGQSEAAVAAMVDTFVLLLVPGAGDELQGIKRGVLELVDLLVVNKADGDLAAEAERARRDYAVALHLVRSRGEGWRPRVVATSATTGAGLDELWRRIEEHRAWLGEGGRLAERRTQQRLRWMWELVDDGLRRAVQEDPAVAALVPGLEAAVRAGETAPAAAAERLLASFRGLTPPAD